MSMTLAAIIFRIPFAIHHGFVCHDKRQRVAPAIFAKPTFENGDSLFVFIVRKKFVVGLFFLLVLLLDVPKSEIPFGCRFVSLNIFFSLLRLLLCIFIVIS